MSIPQPKVPRCGHCKRAHMTVAQARLCAQRYWEARAEKAADRIQW